MTLLIPYTIPKITHIPSMLTVVTANNIGTICYTDTYKYSINISLKNDF